jgi:hypothetical protein
LSLNLGRSGRLRRLDSSHTLSSATKKRNFSAFSLLGKISKLRVSQQRQGKGYIISSDYLLLALTAFLSRVNSIPSVRAPRLPTKISFDPTMKYNDNHQFRPVRISMLILYHCLAEISSLPTIMDTFTSGQARGCFNCEFGARFLARHD